MNREQFIKEQISKRGFNIKSFASYIDMPYSTLLTMLNGSIGGASIDNVIKICKGLQISISDLQEYDSGDSSAFALSLHEKKVISAYRDNPGMQSAVDKLLGVEDGGDIAEDIAATLKSNVGKKYRIKVTVILPLGEYVYIFTTYYT